MNKIPVNSLINSIASDYLNINDRSIHYGDGLFETILCDNNKLYYWQQHFQRLQASAQQLKITCPQQQVLLDDIAKLLDSNESKSKSACAIKIIISRGAGERGYKLSKNTTTNRFVLLSDLEPDHSSLLSHQLLSGELFICKQQASINESLAGLKHLNRLENVMARNEWQGKTADNIIDGLMLNASSFVIEGTMSNIFAVKDNQLYTPAIVQSGVRGIMRDVVLAIASEQNFEPKIKDMTLAELKAMDEIFITNSLIGMKLVNQLDDVLFNNCDTADKIFNAMIKTKEKYVQPV